MSWIRKLNKMTIAGAFLILCLVSSLRLEAQDYPVADSFQYPLDNYIPGSYLGRSFANPRNHLGEDVKGDPSTPVRAIANGRLIRSARNSQGYGQVVVIEHTLPDGGKVCSV